MGEVVREVGGNPEEVVKEEVVKGLIAAGANVNAKDDFGYTPLDWAAQEVTWQREREVMDQQEVRAPHPEVMKALIAAGANIEAQDKDGATPLHKAATPEVVEEVIAEEIIRILTTMKPVLACEVFEVHNYNESLDLLKRLDEDLCQPTKEEVNIDSEVNTDPPPKFFGSLWSLVDCAVDVIDSAVGMVTTPRDRSVAEFKNNIGPSLRREDEVSLVDSFNKIKVLEIRDVNKPVPGNNNNDLIIESDDLKILSYMQNLKTLKIMGNHTAGGMFGSDAKYNLTAIRDLELPEIENVYIDRNEKLKEVSISKLDAERLVISDSDESKFKSIKHYFGDTGRGHGNNLLETINLGEEVKVSNLYIGSSKELKTIKYESRDKVVDELVINTYTEPTLEEVTIPSVNNFYLRKGNIREDGSITISNCHTLYNNLNVFITYSSLIAGECFEFNSISKKFDSKSTKEELNSIEERLNSIKEELNSIELDSVDLGFEIERIYDETGGLMNLTEYSNKIRVLAEETREKVPEEHKEDLYNLIRAKGSELVDMQRKAGVGGFEVLNNYNELIKCNDGNISTVIGTILEVYQKLPKQAQLAIFSPVAEEIFSNCKGLIEKTQDIIIDEIIEYIEGEMTDDKDVYVPRTVSL